LGSGRTKHAFVCAFESAYIGVPHVPVLSENRSRDEGGGEFVEKVTEQDILEVFDATDDPFLTASEIAEQLPVSRQVVYGVGGI